MTRHFRSVAAADPFAVFREPLTKSSLSCGWPLRREKVAHESLVLFPGQDNIAHDQPSKTRRDVRQKGRYPNDAGRFVCLCSDEPYEFLERERLRPHCIEDSVSFLLGGIGHKSRHILYVNWPNLIAAVAGNAKKREVADKPGNCY